MSETITGGCQCGQIRYKIIGTLFGAHICHCRMCQKAFGNLFAALAGVKKSDLHWTKGEPAYYRSSSAVQRGFCRLCGTPLTFAYDHTPHMNISIGSLDNPSVVEFENQYGLEGMVPAFPSLHILPGSSTEDGVSPADLQRLKSFQHPDHD